MNNMREWFTELKKGYEKIMAELTLIRNAQLLAPKPRKMRHPEGEVKVGKTTYTVQKDGSWRKNAE